MDVNKDGYVNKWGFCIPKGMTKEEYDMKFGKTNNSNSNINNNNINNSNNENEFWIQTLYSDEKFKIIETLSDGDCFFDSIYKALPPSKKVTVKEMRERLAPFVDEELLENDKTRYEQAKLENSTEIIEEYKFLDNIATVDDYKKYILTKNFWANSWAISYLEELLNLKFIILNEREFDLGKLKNILQCGDFAIMKDEFDIPTCRICKLTQRDTEFIKSDSTNNTNNINKTDLIKTCLERHRKKFPAKSSLADLIKLYDGLEDRPDVTNTHFMYEKDIDRKYNPDGYIILTYSGNHYRLVSYDDITFFKRPQDLPLNLRKDIKIKCKNVGLYKYIDYFKK